MMDGQFELDDIPDDGGRWKVRLFFILSLVVAFWFIDHDFESSEYVKYQLEDHGGSVNKTADRVENVNRHSTIARTGLGLLCIGSIFLIPNKQDFRWRGPLLLAMVGYFVFCGMSFLWSDEPKLTFLKMGSFTFFVMSLAGVSRQLSLNDLTIVFTSVCAIFIFIGLLAEIQVGNFQPTKSDYRFVGTCHPNVLGGYAVVCCLGASVYSQGLSKISLLTIAMFSIGIVTLLLCKSRTSLFGLVFAIFAIRAITLKPGTRFAAAMLFAVGLVVIFSYFAFTGNRGKSSAGSLAAMGRTENTSTLTGRIPLWEELIERIQERPLLGHGYLAFWDKDQIERLAGIFNWEIPHGHNMYLDVLLDGGVVGLVLFLSMFVIGFAVAVRRYLEKRAIGIAFVFGLIVFALIHGIGESLFKLHTFLSFILFASLLRLAGLPEQSESIADDAADL